ncbi:hypothetical protein PWT90_03523 [Aphanocladium album]|nr:hypothetical protein PWT90_03523 [Aphanocladium album]
MGTRRPAHSIKGTSRPPIRRSSRLAGKPNKIIKANGIITPPHSSSSSSSSGASLSPPPSWLKLSDTTPATSRNPLPTSRPGASSFTAAVATTTGGDAGPITLHRRRLPPRPPARSRNPPTDDCPAAAPLCHFCESDPIGRAMHAQRACDWQDGVYPLECSNCADYRGLNPGTAASHACRVPRRSGRLWRKYSQHHPARYEDAWDPNLDRPGGEAGLACTKCIVEGRRDACDVDPLLGYQCSHCRATDSCRLLSGRAMEPKPNLRQGVAKWFRHACDSCAVLAGKRHGVRLPQCSWLVDRTAWGEACCRCRDNNLACLGSAVVAGLPDAVTIPQSWIPRSHIALGWAELRRNTGWRSACTNCLRDNNHCRASIAHPLSACGRCTVMGLDCVDCRGTAYPIFDLSQVGFGNFLPFASCRRCVEMGRKCDRQRPCDSCTAAGEAHLCDNAFLKTAAGKRRMANCIHGRLDPPPGPLYYLAIGYGANGVNDVKDGSQLEHWIGPAFEAHTMDSPFYHVRAVTAVASRLRLARMPNSVPPHAAPGTPLATLSTSQLTADHISGMISQAWPDAYLLNSVPSFASDQYHAGLSKSAQLFLGRAGSDDPPSATELAQAVNPDPNPAPVHILRVIIALPVVDSPQVAVEAAADQGSSDDTDDTDETDGSDGGNNHAGQFTTMPQPTAHSAAAGQQSGQFSFPQVAPQFPAPQQLVPSSQPPAAPVPHPLMFPQTMTAQPPPLPSQSALRFPRATAILSMFGHLLQQPNQGAPHGTPESRNVDTDLNNASDIPVDPALQVWNPPSPPPVLPFNPLGSPPPPISLDTSTMPGHAMMLPAVPTEIGLDMPDLYNTDLLDPSLTSFLDDAQDLAAAEADMSWLYPQSVADEGQQQQQQQQTFGVNPFAPLPLALEQQQQMPVEQTDRDEEPARWRYLNPLHGFTRELLANRDSAAENLPRKPFTLGISYLKDTCVVKDKLHDILEPTAEDPNKRADMQKQVEDDPEGGPRCAESGFDESGDGTGMYLACGNAAHTSDRCASNQHFDDIPIIVCDGCAQHSSQIIVDPRYRPLTAAEVLSMRAYLCRGCSTKAGASVEAILSMCEAGINKVYGLSPNDSGSTESDNGEDVRARDGGRITFFKHARPMTGCSCGVKMFRTRQCQFHRIEHAEAVLNQVAAVQEWRIQTEQQGKCAGCFEDRSAADMAMRGSNLLQQQAVQSQMSAEELSSWVCLACGGWVMNQAGSAEKPKLVAGWESWFSPQPTSLTAVPEDDDMDVEMTDV